MKTKRLLTRVVKLIPFLLDWNAIRYLVAVRARSVASYGVCRALQSIIKTPRLIIDAGANKGQFACAAKWWFPNSRVVSFEPLPEVFNQLTRNIAEIDGVSAVRSALGDRKGVLEFYKGEYTHESSALLPIRYRGEVDVNHNNYSKTTVPVTTLDEFLGDDVIVGPVLLKLDVQGYEYTVLRGAARVLPQIDYLLLECSYRAFYENEVVFRDMFGYLGQLGFDLVSPVGIYEDSVGVVLQSDLLWRRRA